MEIIITPKAKANLLSFSQNWFFDDLYKPLLKAIEVFSENQINAIQVDGFEVYEKSNRKMVYKNYCKDYTYKTDSDLYNN